MVEAVSTAAPKQFTTVQYNTKDGETITATKKDGVVTLVGDKSGVRKMPIEDFKKELVANVPHLEKTPAKDTVEISKDAKAPTEVQDKDAKTPAEAKVKDAKVDSKEVKVADTKKAEEPAKAEKEVTTDKAPTEEKTPVEEAKKPEIGKKLDVAA
jgi:ABC-type proline/glycine betaine transport system ATPase subunit